MPPNPKHGIPRFGDVAGFALRRGRFLDGSNLAYFGPGQLRQQLTVDGFPIGISYGPITDWPKAKSLLRVPQVVLLSSELSYAGPADNYLYEYSAIIRAGADQIASHYGPFSRTNPDVAENVRLQGVFAAVRDQVEAIRPNRTWVAAIDRTFEATAGSGTAWPYLFAPDIDTPAYFGTNFLHVFAGSQGGYHRRTDPVDFETDADYLAGVANVNRAVEQFSRFRVLVYGVNLDSVKVALPPYTFSYGGSNPTNAADAATITFNRNSSNVTGDLGLSPTSTSLKQYMNDLTTAYYADSLAKTMGSIDASWMPDVSPIAYLGTTLDLDEGSLMTLIADHYGFDPGTGKDLPP